MEKTDLGLEPDPRASKWKDFWGKDEEAKRSLCAPADKARNEDRMFRRALKDRIKTEASEVSLDNASVESLQTLLSSYLGDAEKAQVNHQRRGHGMTKFGRQSVAFANKFGNFLQAYAGIVEIMKGADQQYGGIAYGTLSLFLTVAVNKQQKEERIDSTLVTLQREYSRIEIMQGIYSSQNMKKYIAEAYRLGIEFAREATLYYARSKCRRIFEAVVKPPQLDLDTKISDITTAMTEIEKESRTLNSQRLHQVQRQVDDVQRQVHGIRDEVETSQKQKERIALMTLKDELLRDRDDPNTVLTRYESELQASFRTTGRLRTFDLNRFIQDSTLRRWSQSKKSCILLLHGRTAITTRDYSWLSPATLGLVGKYRREGRTVISHCCHDRVFMEQDTPASLLLSSLIYQLLEVKSSLLRDQSRYEGLRRKFVDPSWRAASPKQAFAVLSELLELFPEVYIMVDRIDRIKGDLDRFMDPLLKLLEDSRCTIKVFLVASSNSQDFPEGKITQDLLETIEDRLGSENFSNIVLNQN